jgi:4-hydroxy 2-oxovalerate aldolase
VSYVNIDVTLRDGGYRNNFDFELDYALAHAQLSVEAGFDWIEVAYRNGPFKPVSHPGLTGRGDDEFISAVADVVGPEHVGLILHSKNIAAGDILAMYKAGARLLRICMSAARPGADFDNIARAKDAGFTVCANLTRVSQMDTRAIFESVVGAADAGVDTVYLADSNGSLHPEQITQLTTFVNSIAPSAVGLHAHNNLGLALSNSIAAVGAGATWIDSSFLGMGKGPGNLCSEQWIAYLNRAEPIARYDLGTALHLADLLSTRVPESAQSMPLPDLVLGHFDLPVEARSSILRKDHREVVLAAHTLSLSAA